MDSVKIKELIEAGIDGCSAYVDGDGSHFVARVVSPVFDGMPMVKQHKLVYGCLGDAMEGAIHALSINTYSPEAWEKAKKFQTF